MMTNKNLIHDENTSRVEADGISLPEEDIQILTADQKLSLTGYVFRQLIEKKRGERAWMVFDLRFHFFAQEQHTFDELGKNFKVTKQMIHLIHKDNLIYVKRIISEGNTRVQNYSLKQEWSTFINNVHRVIGEATNTPCLEQSILEKLTREFGITKLHPFMNLSYELHGIRKIEPATGLDKVCFKSTSKADADRIIHAIVAIDNILTKETSLPLSDMELLSHILNARLAKGLTTKALMDTVRLCSSVEIRDDGKVWGKFTSLTRVNQLERILFEEGKPLKAEEIYKKLSQKLVQEGESVPGRRSLFNQIGDSRDRRFKAIGRWGWKLTMWDEIETRSIVDQMIRCLQDAGKPLTSSEIENYVAERRNVGKKSVRTSLSRPEFKKMGVDLWGLPEWKTEKGNLTWSPEDVAEFVAKYFKRCKTEQVDYDKVRNALATAAKCTAKQANGLLRVNPVIKIHKDEITGKRIAIFQANYSENLDQAHRPFGSNQVTLEQRLQDETVSYLRSCPGRETTLNDLIQRLMRKFGKPYRTIHTYIGRMVKVELIEKNTVSKVPHVRLKTTFSVKSFPAIEKIHFKERREWVIDALPYLNPAEIDKGLFELGKAFEHAVKCYMEKAIENGYLACNGLPITKKDEWKLITMVDCAWTNHLIADKGTFQFLRQERNDRAHGARISPEELKIYWTGAEQFAGMFIQAIQMFDHLEYELARKET